MMMMSVISGRLLEDSYPSAKMQSVYSATPTDWAKEREENRERERERERENESERERERDGQKKKREKIIW